MTILTYLVIPLFDEPIQYGKITPNQITVTMSPKGIIRDVFLKDIAISGLQIAQLIRGIQSYREVELRLHLPDKIRPGALDHPDIRAIGRYIAIREDQKIDGWIVLAGCQIKIEESRQLPKIGKNQYYFVHGVIIQTRNPYS
jgi:hypothetical protein